MVLAVGGIVVLFVGALVLAADYFVEPVLRRRIETLIVQGSDSLYTYHLGKLGVSVFGGSVDIDSFIVEVDSNQYRKFAEEGRLPALTVSANMHHGHMRGLGVLALLLGKRVSIEELATKDAEIELCRHRRRDQPDTVGQAPRQPIWKLIQPKLKDITLKRLQLDGIRFTYRYASDSNNVQLKFDTCTALLKDIRIDSASAADPDRIGFCKSVKLHFYDLKFRSPDSAFKMKAKTIDYDSDERLLSLTDFKMQPTLKDKESFYAAYQIQREMTVIEFSRLDLKRFRMEEFVHNNAIIADSLVIDTPSINIYVDKTYPPTLEGKMGRYPQQQLLKASVDIHIKGMLMRQSKLVYTERAAKSGQEGTLTLDRLDIGITNVTNIPKQIVADSTCRIQASGYLLGKSPINAGFTFFLAEPEGRFKAEGTIRDVQAAQLNGLAEPLAGIRIQSLNLQQMQYSLWGNEYTSYGEVRMRYKDLNLTFLKEDEETGLMKTNNFLTKLVNRFTVLHDNPGPGGHEAVARNVERSRLMTQTFFGLIWQTIFSGMETIMTNTGETL